MSNNNSDILKKFEKVLEKYNVSKNTIFYDIVDTVYSTKLISVYSTSDEKLDDLIEDLDLEMTNYNIPVVSYDELYSCEECNNVAFLDHLLEDGAIINDGFYCDNCLKDINNESLREDYIESRSFNNDTKLNKFPSIKENVFTEEELNEFGFNKIAYGEYGLHLNKQDIHPKDLFMQKKSDKFDKYIFVLSYQNLYEIGFDLYAKKKGEIK